MIAAERAMHRAGPYQIGDGPADHEETIYVFQRGQEVLPGIPALRPRSYKIVRAVVAVGLPDHALGRKQIAALIAESCLSAPRRISTKVMDKLSDFLKATGPNAAIIFAAWIFMGFLQQRYDSAVDRYRAAAGDFRSEKHDKGRAANLKDQIVIYRRRCVLMGRATSVGLVSAIFLISSLMLGGLDVIVPGKMWIGAAGIGASFLGFALVILAAAIVIAEGRRTDNQLDDEVRDVPELSDDQG